MGDTVREDEDVMLYDPARHEPLRPIEWDEGRVRAVIADIVADTERAFSADQYWPLHPRDLDDGEEPQQRATCLYFGACGVIWGLEHLQSRGAVRLSRAYAQHLEPLLERNREWLKSGGTAGYASFMMGDTPILMMQYAREPTAARADAIAALIASNRDNPTRELMWGAPGTMLASLFLHERTGDPRWAALFRESASTLWSQLLWSPEFQCAYWTQDLYGRQSTYLDAVHGFVATAVPLIRGRHLLSPAEWSAWEGCITNTIERTADRDGALANWRPWLITPEGRSRRLLMQFCHGAPGFVVCLAGMPGNALDTLLCAAGEAVWAAGPLTKGSNLCHGTGGNGYAFLKLFLRTGDPQWLDRARAFAMHGIEQMLDERNQVGRLRHSLWTGDPGLAIYLWDCIHGTAAFPTLDVFYG